MTMMMIMNNNDNDDDDSNNDYNDNHNHHHHHHHLYTINILQWYSYLCIVRFVDTFCHTHNIIMLITF